MAPEPGAKGSASLAVGDADTAVRLRSGSLPVLGTPRVVALVEEAAVAALEGQLGPGETSVGVHVDLDHLAATALGASVEATATLVAVDGRTLRYEATVTSGGIELARARHERVVVDAERFMARLGA